MCVQSRMHSRVINVIFFEMYLIFFLKTIFWGFSSNLTHSLLHGATCLKMSLQISDHSHIIGLILSYCFRQLTKQVICYLSNRRFKNKTAVKIVLKY